MTRPGFRKKRAGGGSSGTGSGDASGPFVGSALFSQSQILHLMKTEFARARRHGLALGCLLLQVDRMAQLVDIHGLPMRNAVRHALSDMVRGRTRGADLLGTWSEDRFLLVLPQTNLEQARVVAGRLHRLFRDLEVAVDGKVLALTLSLGVAASEDRQTMFFDSLVAQAEVALEHAMGRGGDQVASFGETQLMGEDVPTSESPSEGHSG